VGKYVFPIEGGVIKEDPAARLGASVIVKGREVVPNPDGLAVYESAHQLAIWAWDNQCYDGVENN
jgi:hypothetical protein